MLEQKVQELLEVRTVITETKGKQNAALSSLHSKWEALPEYNQARTEYDKAYKPLSDALSEAYTEEERLENEILEVMTEKTHKLECATITKKVRRGVKVHDGLAFYNFLSQHAKGLLKKVKYNFPNADIVKLVDSEIISLQHLEPMAEITKTESLAITAKEPN